MLCCATYCNTIILFINYFNLCYEVKKNLYGGSTAKSPQEISRSP